MHHDAPRTRRPSAGTRTAAETPRSGGRTSPGDGSLHRVSIGPRTPSAFAVAGCLRSWTISSPIEAMRPYSGLRTTGSHCARAVTTGRRRRKTGPSAHRRHKQAIASPFSAKTKQLHSNMTVFYTVFTLFTSFLHFLQLVPRGVGKSCPVATVYRQVSLGKNARRFQLFQSNC